MKMLDPIKTVLALRKFYFIGVRNSIFGPKQNSLGTPLPPSSWHYNFVSIPDKKYKYVEL